LACSQQLPRILAGSPRQYSEDETDAASSWTGERSDILRES